MKSTCSNEQVELPLLLVLLLLLLLLLLPC